MEDDFCSADKTAEEVAEYFNEKTIDKIRSEFITNRQNHFEEGTLTHRQAKYGYALSEDRRNLVLNPESAQVVKLIFQMYLEDMKIPEIARALDAQGVPSPQIQMAKKKKSRAKIKWPDSTGEKFPLPWILPNFSKNFCHITFVLRCFFTVFALAIIAFFRYNKGNPSPEGQTTRERVYKDE